MAVIARESITVYHVLDISSVTWYYKLQASTASPPNKPTTNPPPTGWETTEPTYTEGSTNSLYICELTTFSDGTWSYSDVSLSSSYEAAKVAYNKSVATKQALDNMEIGGTNLWIVRDQVSGYVHSNQKSVVAGSAPNWPICSDYIPVTEGESLVIQQWIPNNTATDPPAAYYGFYPEKSMTNPVMASRGTFQGASGDTYLSETITVPTGAKYLRISLRSFGNPDSKIKIERGNMPTSWSPAPEDVSAEITNAIDDISVGGRNYYIIKDSSSGYLASSISSLSAASPSRKERTSDFIAVAPGEKLTMQVWATPASGESPWIAYMFCQSDKETAVGSRVAKFGTANETYLAYINIEVPANAAYVRVSARMWSDGRIKVEKSSMPTDWTPAPEDTDSAITEAQQTASTALLQSVEYIEGTQTAATGSWTGVTTETALYAGKTIAYKLPKAGSGNASLNLTLAGGGTTGAKAVYLNTTRVTTHFGANSIIQMTYDGTYWRATAIPNTNNYDRRLHNNHIKAVTAITAGKLICGTSAGYKEIAANAIFDLSYPILYASAAIEANAQAANAYEVYPSVNLTTTGTIQGAAVNKMAFLKGTLDGNNFIVAGSNFITCTIPTSADGFYYIPLGILANDATTKCFFTSTNRLFAFVRDQFLPVDVAARNIIAALITNESGNTYFDLDEGELRTSEPYELEHPTTHELVEAYASTVLRAGKLIQYIPYYDPLYAEPTLDYYMAIYMEKGFIGFQDDSHNNGFISLGISFGERDSRDGELWLYGDGGVRSRTRFVADSNVEVYNGDGTSSYVDFHRTGSSYSDFDTRLIANDANQLQLEHADGSKTQFRNGNIELYSATGLIDFHFGISHSGDYSSRIRETSSGVLKSYPSAITSGSDQALKKDILPIDARYLELIDKLEPKEFRFKDSPEYKHLGFVAQDVDDILDEIGIEDKPLVIPPTDEDDYYALDYQQIIPALVAYCQDLRKEINELKSRLGE